MPSMSFYTDDETKGRLEQLAEAEKRSVSNYLTLLVNRTWETTYPQPFPEGKGEGKKVYEAPVVTELDGKPAGSQA